MYGPGRDDAKMFLFLLGAIGTALFGVGLVLGLIIG